MRGSVILAMRPTMLWSTGTSRQPAMVHRPSAATTSSTICLACAASLSSFGRNSMPTLRMNVTQSECKRTLLCPAPCSDAPGDCSSP
jgi:hypothetical protein